MKKAMSLILVLAVCLGLCACNGTSSGTPGESSNIKYTVQLKNNTTKQMSVAEIAEMEQTNGREFEELLKGAFISGSGIVKDVGEVKEANWDYNTGKASLWQMGIELDGGISIGMIFAPKDNYPQLYKGDKVNFKATIVGAWTNSISIAVHYQTEGTYVRYAS